MKYLKLFDSVQGLNDAIQGSEISFLGLAYNNGTPVTKNKVVLPPDYSEPFYVENITNSNKTLRIVGYDSADCGEEGYILNYLEIPVEYSTDGTTWATLGTTGENDLTLTLQPGDKIYLRATTNVWYEYKQNGDIDHGCYITGVPKVGGNIMSLLYGSSFTGNETTFPSGSSENFRKLFFDDGRMFNNTLTDISDLLLPATTLTESCYQSMFSYCSALTTVPSVLPATTLAYRCYTGMFYGCSALTTAPALPATTLANECYSAMFSNCSSLTSAPTLPATTLAERCYSTMFSDCTALTTAPALPATILANYCYQSMFRQCSSLTTIPTVLPATTLVEGCYSSMFAGCTSLTIIPLNLLPTTTLAQSCYNYMFMGCTSLTTTPALPATTLTNNCYYGMFYNCSALTTAPELPATTLTQSCYNQMFSGCTHLNYIKCLATDKSVSYCTSDWVTNVAATGTFVKNPNMTTSTWGTGTSGIPSGWTVEDATE